MLKDLMVWSSASQSWRSVRMPEPHRFRFEPLNPTMTIELRRRADRAALRSLDGLSAWQAPINDWVEPPGAPDRERTG